MMSLVSEVIYRIAQKLSSVQFSRSIVPNSLWPLGLQYARLPCPSPTPRAYSSSCPLSRWCHPSISSSVIPFSFHLQSFPASGCFPMSQFFASGGQSIGASAPACPSNEYSELISFTMDWLDFCSPKDSQESSPAPQFKSINSSLLSSVFQLSHPYMTTGKVIALTMKIFVSKWCLYFLIHC